MPDEATTLTPLAPPSPAPAAVVRQLVTDQSDDPSPAPVRAVHPPDVPALENSAPPLAAGNPEDNPQPPAPTPPALPSY